MSDVAGLGLEEVANPLAVTPATDHFGDPQHGVQHWNETTFFEAWAPAGGFGVFLHMGRSPKDLDLWWCQAITYLPDSKLTSDVNWGRTTEAGARTGNVAVDVTEPLQRWTLRYDGAGEPTDTDRLGQGLSGAGVRVPVRWDLEAKAIGPIWDLQASVGSLPDFARGSHTQQTYGVSGTITVDGVEHPVSGVGCNDHSRGVRDLSTFGGDQWVVGIMPGSTFHVLEVWRADGEPVFTAGAWFDGNGYRPVTARRQPVHTIDHEPKAFDLVVVDDGGAEQRFGVEVLHGCTVSVTQQHDNLNGLGWDLPGDSIVLNESPIRITAATGEVGYGHLERSMRLDQAARPLRPFMARG